jgi:hypothetical protein
MNIRKFFLYLILNIMKTLTSKIETGSFADFILSSEEMINVRGGENDPIVKTTVPPIII